MKNYYYFKSFWNFIRRNKLFTAINVFGFAFALMFVILLGFYIQREYTVDSNEVNKDRIYRMEYTEGSQFSTDYAAGVQFSGVIPGMLEGRYPEIDKMTRVAIMYDVDVAMQEDENARYKESALMVDSTFFSIFSFPYVEGGPSTAMRTKDEIVLTESTARKIFGTESALGKTIRMNNLNMTVSAVLQDLDHTHFKNPGLFFHIEMVNNWWGNSLQNGYSNFVSIYFLAHPGADLPARAGDIEEYLYNAGYPLLKDGLGKNIQITPLEDLYLSPLVAYFGRTNNKVFLTVLLATALLILFFAVINYINLSVAQTGFRAQEAAMRRLLGGSRGELFRSLILESITICAASFLIGLGLAFAFEPIFQHMLDTEVTVAGGLTWTNIGMIIGGVFLLGVLSGIVPALAISSFQPIEVVRGTFKRKTKMVYSKVLIGFQYCITIALIGCTLTMTRQVDYMTSSDIGFDKDCILAFNNPGRETAAFINRLKSVPGVEQVAQSDGAPTIWGRTTVIIDKEDMTHNITFYRADTAFVSMMGFEVLHTTGGGQTNGWWLNETAWRQLGLKEGDTEFIGNGDFGFHALGVLKDFHTTGFGEPIGEVAITVSNNPDHYRSMGNILVKVSKSDPFRTRDRIGELYGEMYGANLFDANFIDHWIEIQYTKQKKMIGMLGTLSLLAITISALGMLAMATYFARQRSQEVAVRKVFGALTREVLGRLMASFMKLVVVAFVFAVPVIWYAMREWLMEYAYRINLSWTIFALAGLIALSIAGCTVLWQSLKVAMMNPVRSLKSE